MEPRPIVSSKEQMDHLLKLIQSNSLFGLPNGSLTRSGSTPNVLCSCLESALEIIDSGASDYMTVSHLFIYYSPYPSSKKVGIINGGLSPIAGK